MDLFTISPSHTMYRIGVYVLVVAAAAGAGFYQGKGTAEVRTIEHEGRTLIEFKDRVVTVERVVHADGTIEERTITRDTSKDTEVVTHDSDTTVIPTASKYSLGIRYQSAYSELISQALTNPYKGLEVEVGRRILGPIWLDVGAGMERVTLGVRYDF